MLDIGWTELLVVGIVALIVVGPKDLPQMFRTLGQMTAKARAMAREFQRAMDDAADASGVKDVARDLRKATDLKGTGLDEINKLKSWDPLKDDDKASEQTEAEKADDEALEQISAEMERLRAERARDKATPPPTAPTDDASAAPAPDATPSDTSKS